MCRLLDCVYCYFCLLGVAGYLLGSVLSSCGLFVGVIGVVGGGAWFVTSFVFGYGMVVLAFLFVGRWVLVVGSCWLLVVGCWLLMVGCWFGVVGPVLLLGDF